MFSIGKDWISCLQIKGNENDFMKNSKFKWNFVSIL